VSNVLDEAIQSFHVDGRKVKVVSSDPPHRPSAYCLAKKGARTNKGPCDVGRLTPGIWAVFSPKPRDSVLEI
jgi:hypothetical protein